MGLRKGLYAQLISKEKLDEAIVLFATQLARYNPDALRALKAILGRNFSLGNTINGTGKISGKLVLSTFTKTP